MEPVSSRRYLALWLDRFSTDRARRQSQDSADPQPRAKPFALIGTIKNARRLVAVNQAAERAGLHVGLSLADACAMVPKLAFVPEAPQDDARQLAQLAQWCERYTPLVGLNSPDGLVFDITGAAHLFGGEAALVRDVAKRLAGFGFGARIGLADTLGAAWAVARHGGDAIIAPGQTAAALAPLPVVALRLAGETRAGLIQLGFRTIGDIMARPRAPLAARFGVGLLRRLDQALGREEEPINPFTPMAPLSAEQGFAEPVLRDEDLLGVVGQLTERLCASLEKRGEGARRMSAHFFGVEGKVFRLDIGTSRPLRDAARINRLFTDKFALSTWDSEFGFDRIRVSVVECETNAPVQVDLGQGDFTAGEDGHDCAHLIAPLIDRLSVRLGEHRVLRLLAQDTHVPEQACVTIPAGCAEEFGFPAPHGGKANAQDSFASPRPLRLFERPEPIEAIAEVPDSPPVKFRWRRLSHEIARVEGPERIAMPWWRDGARERPAKGDGILTRDYFRVETTAGARLWLFREGLYSETANPRWFLHGFLP